MARRGCGWGLIVEGEGDLFSDCSDWKFGEAERTLGGLSLRLVVKLETETPNRLLKLGF
jgi:hypothetical protein